MSSGVTMTYKILYNSAVAMTGGQDATGQIPVPQLAAKLMAEGVKEVVVTTDEPDRYDGVSLPPVCRCATATRSSPCRSVSGRSRA